MEKDQCMWRPATKICKGCILSHCSANVFPQIHTWNLKRDPYRATEEIDLLENKPIYVKINLQKRPRKAEP